MQVKQNREDKRRRIFWFGVWSPEALHRNSIWRRLIQRWGFLGLAGLVALGRVAFTLIMAILGKKQIKTG